MLDGPTTDDANDVDRLAVDQFAAVASSSPSNSRYGTVANPKQVLDHDVLMLVGGVVRTNDVSEAVDAPNRSSSEALMVQVVRRNDGGRVRWIAGGEHCHHRPEYVAGGAPVHSHIVVGRDALDCGPA